MTLRHDPGHARPGDRLRAFAQRICTPDTVARVVDPLIADLQHEHASAAEAGHPWTARRHRLAGYRAFWATLAICAGRAAGGGIREWAAADERAMGRTLGYSAAIITSLVFLLALVPLTAVLRRADSHPLGMLFLYLIPQAIPLAVMFGLPLGILVGLRGRTPTTRVRWNVIRLAFLSGALTFVVCAWVLPEANQAFRLLLVGRPKYLARGANELGFGELTLKLAAYWYTGWPADLQPFVYSFHARLASSTGPIIWGVFAIWLASITRRTLVSMITFVAAGITYIAGAIFVIDGSASSGSFWLPYVIWLPNVLFAIMTLVLWIAVRREPTLGTTPASRT